MAQLVEVKHSIAIAAHQQCLAAWTGRRPFLHKWKEKSTCIDMHHHGKRRRARARRAQWRYQRQAWVPVRINIQFAAACLAVRKGVCQQRRKLGDQHKRLAHA